MLNIVIREAAEDYFGYQFCGFSYHYEYESDDTAIFYIYDRANWELDGDITGATIYNQSSCSSPVVTCGKDTEWTTEGKLFWLEEQPGVNSVMTHNLPRWASHQCFDFQYKENATLAGIYERVDLIRTVLQKDKNKPELKVFDKHIFNETKNYSTMANPGYQLFYNGIRIDTLLTDRHKQTMQDYYQCLPFMHRRYLQEDEKSIIWQGRDGKESVIWNYTPRSLDIQGHVTDITENKNLLAEKSYKLESEHTYKITQL